MRAFFLGLLLVGLPGRAALAGTVVSGHIAHPQDKTVSIIVRPDALSGQPVEQVQATLDAKGDFRLPLTALRHSQEVVLRYGQDFTFLFLAPGDDLRFTVDAQRFGESLRFAGPGAAAVANTYLAQDQRQFGEAFETELAAKAQTATLPELLQLSKRQLRQRQAFLRTYAAAHHLLPAFRAYARQSLVFGQANNQLLFPAMYASLSGNAPVLPKGYFDFLAPLRPAQDSAFAANIDGYRAFMGAFATTRLAAGTLPASGEALLTAVGQQFGPGPSRNVVLATSMQYQLQEHEASELVSLMPAFRRSVTDLALVRMVRAQYRRGLLLAAGHAAPALAVHDDQGKPVSLADFRGKVVYLDFWASWCGPCMEEVPASLGLKTKFEGQEVVFLYVSLDDDEAKWTDALTEFPMTSANSVHTWSKGFSGPAGTAYQVTRIPTYFLIGRDGRVVTSHAPRPSDGEATVAALHQALGK